MKFPESWLREHVTVAASRDELAASLTAIGLEVEGVEDIGAALEGVVVAEILSASKHPEADRLQVCQVSIGAGEPVQIVCGAPERARRPEGAAGDGRRDAAGRHGDQGRETARRRIASACCARPRNWRSIPMPPACWNCRPTRRSAQPLAGYLGLPDASFELKLTPNRADCFSVRGVAFDVAAALGTQVNATADPGSRGHHAGCDRRAAAGRRRLPALSAAASSKASTRRAHAAVDERAPQARRPAPDQPAGGHHQLRDARTRASRCMPSTPTR